MLNELLNTAFFPWEGLPYPCEQAKLGLHLIKKGELEAARKLVPFQLATLDHRLKPLYSLFRQEKGHPFAEIEKANRLFFEALDIVPDREYHYVDPKLGIVSHREGKQTIACFGSGCKSGMGAFLVENQGVITFGPQLRPLGGCEGFGLAGMGRHIEATASTLRYQCRLAAPHERETGLPWLKDSGYCGTWIESKCSLNENSLTVLSELIGFRPLSDLLFSIFLKADACFVAGSHKLNPRSLDRYQGPPQSVKLDGLTLSPDEGFQSMEVIPLAGDTSYWGADFLVALEYSTSPITQVSIVSE